MTHQDKSSDSLLDNLNTPDLPILDLNSMDADDTVQFDLWTHGTDVPQDTAISAVDDSTHEQRPDVNFSRLSTPWWDATQPSDQFSNSTLYPAGDTIGNLPIVAANHDPFFGHENASDLPTLSGLVSPSQASIPFPSTLPSAFSPPSQHLLLDVANGLDEPDLSNFFDEDIPNALSALGDPSSKMPLDILDSTPTAESTLPNPRDLSTIHTLDQPVMPVMIPEINERQHRPILPKPPLAAEAAPPSRAQPTPAHQRPSAPMSTSPLRPTDVVLHQPGIPGTKRKRSLMEENKANQSIPSSMLCEFPASSMNSKTSVREQSPKDPAKKQTRAKKGAKKCLRCHDQKKLCDGGFPCGNCQGFWSRLKGTEVNQTFWRVCIDLEICELNIFKDMFDFLSHLFEHSDVLDTIRDVHRNHGSFFDASVSLIAMVLDSPLEAGTGRALAETLHPSYTTRPPRKLSSKTYQSMLWYPRRPTEEYYSNSGCSDILLPLAMLYQQDNLASITGLSRIIIHRSSSAFFWKLFTVLRMRLKKLRSKDATRQDRDFLVPWLLVIQEVASCSTFISLIWQTIFLETCKNVPSHLGNCGEQDLLDTIIRVALQLFVEMLEILRSNCLLERMVEAEKHLHIYCSYWLKQFARENALPDAFNGANHYHIFACHLTRLTLDNDANFKSASDPYVKQECHSNRIYHSIARLGLVYGGDARSIFGDLIRDNKKFRYQDFPKTPSSSEAIVSGHPKGGADKANAVVDQFLEALSDSELNDLLTPGGAEALSDSQALFIVTEFLVLWRSAS